ncbi:MAG: hypothetical protein ACD_78C00459G0003 [uncultured bacterium (gcode 4)]|uniref:Uncharacterized protein n=1 Tax=uncultured bacterium (gcode 4) TaxID=1234023 RepID=K1YA15_9BACT|nr:MAG: hypothetical protein ACD_78C00459G0003 [uncultured bacterium (gcode 4)]
MCREVLDKGILFISAIIDGLLERIGNGESSRIVLWSDGRYIPLEDIFKYRHTRLFSDMPVHIRIERDEITKEIEREMTNESIQWVFFRDISLYLRIDIDIVGDRVAEIYVGYGWLRSGQIWDIVGDRIEWSERCFGHFEDEFHFELEVDICLDLDPIGETHREIRVFEIDEINRRLPLSLRNLSDLIPRSPLWDKWVDIHNTLHLGDEFEDIEHCRDRTEEFRDRRWRWEIRERDEWKWWHIREFWELWESR